MRQPPPSADILGVDDGEDYEDRYPERGPAIDWPVTKLETASYDLYVCIRTGRLLFRKGHTIPPEYSNAPRVRAVHDDQDRCWRPEG